MLVVCPYPVGVAPSQRLKYEQYFAHIREAGFDIDIVPFMSLRLWENLSKQGALLLKTWETLIGYWRRCRLIFGLRRYDVVYVHLWIVPFGPALFEYVYAAINSRLIYDIDDMIHLQPRSATVPLIHRFKSAERVHILMTRAKHVVTCTPHLDAFARQFNRNTTDISSTVDTDSYRPANTYRNDHRLILGWSGSFSTARYLLLLQDVLRTLTKEIDFTLLVMGVSKFEMAGVDIEVVPWSESMEVPTLQRMDIGLYPLPMEEWVLGKSGLKAIQYMALGLPTVATAIGANFRVIEHGVSGLLVDSEEEWLDALRRLTQSPDLREKLGSNARARVLEQYSVRANAPKYVHIVKSVSRRE